MTKTILTLLLAGALLAVSNLPAAPQEQSKADEVFAALDTNRDGKLSQAEFNQIFEMEGQQNASEEEKQNTFKAWDGDGDGAVSKAEFSAKYR